MENERIERHIMKEIPGGHNLFVPDSEVSRKIENLYNRFKVMLVKRDEASRNRVTALLTAIDQELGRRGSRSVRMHFIRQGRSNKCPVYLWSISPLAVLVVK